MCVFIAVFLHSESREWWVGSVEMLLVLLVESIMLCLPGPSLPPCFKGPWCSLLSRLMLHNGAESVLENTTDQGKCKESWAEHTSRWNSGVYDKSGEACWWEHLCSEINEKLVFFLCEINNHSWEKPVTNGKHGRAMTALMKWWLLLSYYKMSFYKFFWRASRS